MSASLVWMVVWVDARGHGLGMCGHRHATSDEAGACPFEPAELPDVCAGLVREVRDPDYRTDGQLMRTVQKRRPLQLEFSFLEAV